MWDTLTAMVLATLTPPSRSSSTAPSYSSEPTVSAASQDTTSTLTVTVNLSIPTVTPSITSLPPAVSVKRDMGTPRAGDSVFSIIRPKMPAVPRGLEMFASAAPVDTLSTMESV